MEERNGKKVLATFTAIIAAIAGLCTIIYFCTNSNLPGLIEKASDNEPSDSGGIIYDDLNSESEYPIDLEVCHFPNIGFGDPIFAGTWQATGIQKDIAYGAWSIKIKHRLDPSEEFVSVDFFGLIQYDTKWKEYKYNRAGDWNIIPADVNEFGNYEHPKGSFGTFMVFFPDIRNIDIGYYYVEITINIDGEDRSIIYPLWMDEYESYLGASRREE